MRYHEQTFKSWWLSRSPDVCVLVYIEWSWMNDLWSIWTSLCSWRRWCLLSLCYGCWWQWPTLSTAFLTTLIYIEGTADIPGGLYFESLSGTRWELDCAITASRHPLYRYRFYSDENGCYFCRAQDPWMETSTMVMQRQRPLHIQCYVLNIALLVALNIFHCPFYSLHCRKYKDLN